VDELTDALYTLNTMTQHKFGCRIFRSEAKSLKDLKNPITNREGFVMRILGIATIIDEVFVDDIKKHITRKPQPGSINLIQALFEEKNVNYDIEALRNLRDLHFLRSNTPPIHSGEYKSIPILQRLGINYPIDNWASAGEKCFLDSISTLIRNIQYCEKDAVRTKRLI
jgi:hypothetical protein